MFNLWSNLLAACVVSAVVAGQVKHKGFTPLGAVPSTSNAKGGSKFLYLSNRADTWNNAWMLCRQAFNGVLVAIESAQEDLFIKDIMVANNLDSVWTSGIYDNGWRWGEGNLISTSGYSNFGLGYPRFSAIGSPEFVFAYRGGLCRASVCEALYNRVA